jgi:hypothetical protein
LDQLLPDAERIAWSLTVVQGIILGCALLICAWRFQSL